MVISGCMVEHSAKIAHVIVVAGPSGSGKTTLMRQLAAGLLSPEIRSHLPQDAERWAQVHGNRHPAWLPRAARGEADGGGIVLHYDLTRDGLSFVDEYARDPALQIVRLADRVTFLLLRPSTTRLLRQWGQAKMGIVSSTRLRSRRILGAVAGVAASLVRIMPLWSPRHRAAMLKRLEALRPRSPHILALYLRDGGVEAMFRAWDRFVTSLKADGIQLTEIRIAPDPAAEIGHGRWLIVSRPPEQP
jgi:hypothetical protein